MSSSLLEPIDCELIIGIVGAVGTKFSEVIQKLEEQLNLAGYVVEKLKVSRDVIEQIVEVESYSGEFERYSAYMKAGNRARKESKQWHNGQLKVGNNAILALGVAARIFEKSNNTEKAERQPKFKRAFIVDSLKRKEEVQALRSIYGDGFILVGIHENEEQRVRNLAGQDRMSIEEAKKLIERDHEELVDPYGQRVNQTFHLADFFVEIVNERNDLECNIRRLVEIWFGHPFRTPTFGEYAMYMAYSAALRSADLSRQVGAVLTRREQILSTGANECPKAFGGLYWTGRSYDENCASDFPNGRDYLRGVDSNRGAQREIVEEIVSRFYADTTCDEANVMRTKLDSSPIKDLTEYGRVVHAEMEALLACGRLGVPTQDATLFCTTFPCHNCAKHIVAAGVRKVVFIEPYPKSRALEHHSDSICEGEFGGYVQFVPFTGVGPRRFFDLFSIDGSSSYRIERKNRDTGKVVKWKLSDSRLRIQMKAFTYLDAETQAARLFKDWIPSGEGVRDDG